MKTCALEECDNNSRARGWCPKHYQRWKKYGDPRKVEIIKTFSLEDALAVRTEWVNGCLLWTGACTEDGYAQYNGENKKYGTTFLHRIMWEREHGAIPDGLEIDHLCFVRNCINTDHFRLADRFQQTAHLAGLKSNNKSGVRGVHWVEREQKWLATLKKNKKTYYLGRFDAPEDAKLIVQAKLEELHGIIGEKIAT